MLWCVVQCAYAVLCVHVWCTFRSTYTDLPICCTYSYIHVYIPVPYLHVHRSRVYWRTVPRSRSGSRTRLSDVGGSTRGTRRGPTQRRRRAAVTGKRGRGRQGRRRIPNRTRRLNWSHLFIHMTSVGRETCFKWVGQLYKGNLQLTPPNRLCNMHNVEIAVGS